MASIELLDFQQRAADKLVESALDYFARGQDSIGGRPLPFIGQLKAVTGAGKTPILANVLSRMGSCIILWTTKFGSVVDQTVTNLGIGGKYSHLLGAADVEVINFSDIQSAARWHYILEKKTGVTILVSTVAAWRANVKDERLNVHRVDSNSDWGDRSRWDQLNEERNRPLWVVYDEAHNTTSEQVEQLDELNPAGFFVASATELKGKLHQYLSMIPAEARQSRIASVKTRDVVDAELLKSTISLADYDSPTEQMLADVVQRRDGLEAKFAAIGSAVIPKCIYVVESSNTSADDREARPVIIWRTLTEQCNVSPQAIAICTNTKTLPKEAVRVATIDQLSDQFTHIIFNKKLQEGWDDPSVYVCYFDGKTDAATRIQQVLGRALRQPNVRHLSDEDLNTAYFFVNCPTEALEKITDQLKEELRVYKGDDDDNFEPFQIREERKAPPRIPVKPEYEGKLRALNLMVILSRNDSLKRLIERNTYEFGDDDLSAPGRAVVNVVSVRTGDVQQNTRDLFEDMRVRCGTYLEAQIRAASKDCASSLPTSVFVNEKLDKRGCYKSRALDHYRKVAAEVFQQYESMAQLAEQIDEEEREYVVGPYQPSGSVMKEFQHAGHPQYDSKSFNPDELDMAKALDRFSEYVWVRNKDRRDYGIKMPVKSDASSTFYPDFLWWVKDTVWAIDPTGKFILEEKIRTKLLAVPAPLKIALVTRGQIDLAHNQPTSNEGWSLVRRRIGNVNAEHCETLNDLLNSLVADS